MTTYYGQRDGVDDSVELEVQASPESVDGYRDPKEPDLDHLIQDLWDGLEEDNFEVETPRVCVEKEGFDRLHVSKTFGEPWVQHAGARGPPLCELDIEWHGPGSELGADLIDTKAMNNSVVLYGGRHVWSISDTWHCEVDTWIDGETYTTAGEATISFREQDFEWIDWR